MPAAKASRKGNAGTTHAARSTVSTDATGSTSPVSVPIQNDLKREFPALRKGIDTMAPSGKFCIAMPIDSVSAPAMGMKALCSSTPAIVAPTASPSGILWMVTAITSFFVADMRERGPSSCWLTCICGVKWSRAHNAKKPATTPAATGTTRKAPSAPSDSKAGISNDHTEAATITPDAKPRSTR